MTTKNKITDKILLDRKKYFTNPKSINEAIQDPLHNMIFGQDYKDSSDKTYFTISKDNEEEIFNMVKKNNNLYELICKNIPTRFYIKLGINKMKSKKDEL